MTIPDKLIDAGTEAKCVRRWMNDCSDAAHKHPECVIAAAFAALPECDEAVDVVASALVAAWNKQTYLGQTAQKDAETAVAALARMAQP